MSLGALVRELCPSSVVLAHGAGTTVQMCARAAAPVPALVAV